MLNYSKLTYILFLTILFHPVSKAIAKSSDVNTLPNLTCDYFDNLRKNSNCETFNKGKPIEVKPSGKNKDLYRAAYKIINSYNKANCIILNVTKGVKTKGSLTHN